MRCQISPPLLTGAVKWGRVGLSTAAGSPPLKQSGASGLEKPEAAGSEGWPSLHAGATTGGPPAPSWGPEQVLRASAEGGEEESRGTPASLTRLHVPSVGQLSYVLGVRKAKMNVMRLPAVSILLKEWGSFTLKQSWKEYGIRYKKHMHFKGESRFLLQILLCLFPDPRRFAFPVVCLWEVLHQTILHGE